MVGKICIPAYIAIIGSIVLGLVTQAISLDVTTERIQQADQDANNWITYYRTYQGWRYSPLQEINTTNIQHLETKWTFETGPDDENFQVTPLVADGVMYLINCFYHVMALDAASGELLWRYNHELPPPDTMPAATIHQVGAARGLALAQGKVLVGTGDAALVALDAKTGKPLWKAQVGDYTQGQTITSPPLIVKEMAIVGISTLPFPTRGFIAAYDLATGQQTWRFYTIPGPGEPGHETWSGDSWRYGCGSAWVTGTYDPDLNLIFMGIGNPCAQWNGDKRQGDNLYTGSVVALNVDTGHLQWYFQAVPHDVWDFDAISELILVDLEIEGKPVKALVQAEKNGYFYAFERATGRLLYAKPFVSKINWTTGLDGRGRPQVAKVPTRDGAVLCPSFMGAKNWNHMAYSQQTGYVYVPVSEMCQGVRLRDAAPQTGRLYVGARARVVAKGAYGMLKAIDVQSGEMKWGHRTRYPLFASVLATGGGLVLTGDLEGNVLALDAAKGQRLWTFNTGSGHRGSPITYAVDGKQYIAVPSGWGGFAKRVMDFSFPELKEAEVHSKLFVFGLSDDFKNQADVEPKR